MRIYSIVGLFMVAIAAAQSTSNITAQSIWDAIENAATCTACEALLVLLQALAHTGNDNFDTIITSVCILAGIEDDDVCEGAIGEQGPILAHDLRELTVGTHTAELFCTTLFGLCDYPAVRDYEVTFPTAKPANATRPSPSGQEPIKVVHFSDIHVDLSYEVGANYNCTKPICCRPYTSADAPGNTSYPAGEYGEVTCDAPLSLEESMYAAIQDVASDAAFAIFTGDVVEGAVWLVTEKENTDDIDDAYQNRMQSTFPLLYGTTGNHEAAPVNSFPPDTINTTISSQWVYDTLSSDWETWIGAEAATTADQYGAYAVNYSSSLKVISMNSNFYYTQNFWLFEATMQYDPYGQLAWLVSELQQSEDVGQNVWIIAHMPMGSSSALHDGSNYFQQIVDRYSATIAAMFFGHTHKDEFEISYSNYTNRNFANAIAMSYIAPAMTPTSGNPSFRVYSVDPVTFGVLDFTEYIANLSASGYQDGPTWEVYYSAKETYGSLLTPPATESLVEMTPAFWHNVTEVFQSNDTAFQQYYARKNRGYSASTCTGTCITDEICQLQSGEAQYNCVEVTPGINLRKSRLAKRSDGTPSAAEDDCDKSVPSNLFSAAVANFTLLDHVVSTLKAGLDA